ncbi:IS3 family transposase ISMco1 [Rubrobacter xylanophilus DSM 9941]|nr:IS3 family transposase ISMco1 [Rubrobacter xylanophilus DSM 9941]
MAIEKLCELMGVSRSWYYERPSATEKKAKEDVALQDAIERIVLGFPGYGYRRVSAALRREGWAVNRKRVLRIMREESLLCQLKRRFVPTTDSAHAFGRYPNLIKATRINELDQAWIADITYIRLPTTFCYLAAILDAYSRRCVGWHLSRFIDTRLTPSALEMALATRSPAVGLIHHSDQGVQYASSEYVLRLEEAGALISMAAVGNPYENAQVESFFRTLKMEEVYIKDYRDFEEAQENIAQFIEEVYNQKRLHSSLGYLPPVEFEARHALEVRS